MTYHRSHLTRFYFARTASELSELDKTLTYFDDSWVDTDPDETYGPLFELGGHWVLHWGQLDCMPDFCDSFDDKYTALDAVRREFEFAIDEYRELIESLRDYGSYRLLDPYNAGAEEVVLYRCQCSSAGIHSDSHADDY